MTRDPSPMRIWPVAVGVALILLGGWRSWKEFGSRRDAETARARLAHAESLAVRYSDIADSICQRRGRDTLAVRDPVEWTAHRHGLAILNRGREGHWDWGCLRTPDSGFVLLVARDSGCVRFSGGSLWTDACHVATLIHDRKTWASTFPRNTTFSRSLWSYPGADRVCRTNSRPEPPPWDSLAERLCRVRP
jgi:hypothetical protein